MNGFINEIISIAMFKELASSYKSIDELKDNELKFFYLYLEKDDMNEVLEFLREENPQYKLRFKLLEERGNTNLFRIIISEGDIECSSLILFDKSEHLASFISDADYKGINIITSFLESFYPFAKRAFISSDNILKIINSLINEGYNLKCSMISLKRLWAKIDKRRTGIEYPIDIPIKIVLKEVQDKKAFLNSINLTILDKENNMLLKCYISRKGYIKYIDGYYELFEKKIILPINFSLIEEYHCINKLKEKVCTPLKLTFAYSSIINYKQALASLIQKLNDNKIYSLIIHHEGNPYYFAEAIDLANGSSFNILFYDQHNSPEMIVIPKTISSSTTLINFFSYIFSELGEGLIEAYTE